MGKLGKERNFSKTSTDDNIKGYFGKWKAETKNWDGKSK